MLLILFYYPISTFILHIPSLVIDLQSKMLFGCFCTGSTVKTKFNKNNKYFQEVSARLIPEEINILTLIYDDLVTRNTQNMLLAYQDFLSFFNLTGLWGAKLFECFDEDKQQLISFEEFLYGISRTAKAPFEQKVKLMYYFFEQEHNMGIEFKSFTKMLYNYSKQELKDILIEDYMVDSPRKSSAPDIRKKESEKIIELDIMEKQKKPINNFDLTYQYLLDAHNHGTYYEINTEDLTYKVKFSNMSTLIEEFAQKVYLQHGIDVNKDTKSTLSYDSFKKWLQSHGKLFKSYFSAFHTELWAYQDGTPNYLQKRQIDLQFSGQVKCGQEKKKELYAFQAGDAIIFCESKKKVKEPIKIICLQGLTIKQNTDQNSIEISHRSQSYKTVTLFFDDRKKVQIWMNSLRIYEHDTLYSNYVTGDVIGTGKFSIVYKCTQKCSQKNFALKVIDLAKLTPQGRKAISNQSATMKILNHPQIVKYKETIRTKKFEYIITEYIYGEELYHYVRKRGKLNEFESAFIIGQIISCVIFIHGMGILHRDLKPQNIMVMFKEKKEDQYFQCTTPTIRKGQRIQNIKIIDFGLSNQLSKIKKMTAVQRVIGTPNYIAPEILSAKQPTLKSDNFSIGCILYFLLRGRLPFAEQNVQKTIFNTVFGNYQIEGQHWDRISPQAKDLLKRLLQGDPQQRINLKQALNHQWFSAVWNISRSSKTLSQSEGRKSDQNQISQNQYLQQKINSIDGIKLNINQKDFYRHSK